MARLLSTRCTAGTSKPACCPVPKARLSLRQCHRATVRAHAAAAAAPTSQPGRAPWAQPTASALQVEQHLTAKATGSKAAPLVLYFTKATCGPCKLVTREVDKLRLQYVNKATVLTVDIEADKELAQQCGISAVPTILFVGHADPVTPAILVQGNVTSKLLADVLDNKIQFAGADLRKARRLF